MLDTNLLLMAIQGYETQPEVIAQHDFNCFACNSPVYEGDKFYFLGYRKRVCDLCRLRLIELLKDYEKVIAPKTQQVETQ